jgi:hypothetical protein
MILIETTECYPKGFWFTVLSGPTVTSAWELLFERPLRRPLSENSDILGLDHLKVIFAITWTWF